jgi:hypothetical protein
VSTNLITLRRRLRPDPDPEVDAAFAAAVVIEVDQLDGLGVHHYNFFGSNLV